ncbi:hypothetical protein DL93DRAFT_2153207 [Clavulina sp. PMI_390]|nr:hypothetical protein DL93DRAFT_2153207 [Clavulina sp. PMI_390]
MDKWRSNESIFGVGGKKGKSTEHLRDAEIALQQGKPSMAQEHLRKAMKADPTNLDALMLQASISSAPTLPALRAIEKTGRKALLETLGPDAFDDDGESVGHYWGLIETRPYIRVLTALRETCAMQNKWAEAVKWAVECLRLCPNDNLGVREYLPLYLIYQKRYLEALSFIMNWIDDEESPERGGIDFQGKSASDYDPTLSGTSGARLRKNIEGGFDSFNIYNGARAAFELYGDCEMSRCFLRTAAKINPYILRRIVGRADIPDDFCRHPRTVDGIDAAIDYLYVGQRSWYTNEKVLDWMNNDRVTSKITRLLCSNPPCGKREATACSYQACSKCKEVVYCSRNCQVSSNVHFGSPQAPTPRRCFLQVAHWKLPGDEGHKKKCKAVVDYQKQMETYSTTPGRAPNQMGDPPSGFPTNLLLDAMKAMGGGGI